MAEAGGFPETYEGLLALPGIGPYTAAAVASAAFGVREAAVDGNVISFDLKGSGAIGLRLVAKRPGPELDLQTADVDLELDSLPDGDPLPPYVRLIHDVLLGDRSLFTRPDGLDAVWTAAAPLLDNPPKVEPYAQGSWGPQSAEALAEPDGWLLGG